MKQMLSYLVLCLIVAGCTSPPQKNDIRDVQWDSKFLQDHSLVGKIWSARTQGFVDQATLVADMAEQDFVLLGEKHNNTDHHRIQAWLVAQMFKRNRRMAVAFEMFSSDKAETLSDFQASGATNAADIAALTDWETSGWPDWSVYQPIAQHALDAGVPLLAANMTRQQAMTMARENKTFLDDRALARLRLDRPLPAALVEVKSKELIRGHCNMLPEHMVQPMLRTQTTRDAIMADVMIAATISDNPNDIPKDIDGAILITGAGHARSDWGVPWHIKQRSPKQTVLSIALLEVHKDSPTVDDYSDEWDVATLPFDYIWFTPRVDMEDPCDKYAKQLKMIGKSKSN